MFSFPRARFSFTLLFFVITISSMYISPSLIYLFLPTPLTPPPTRWVVFLSGLAHITLPNSTLEAYIPGGKNGAILALDTADVSTLGHITTYPSQETTVALEIPLGEEGVPGHRVLHMGACRDGELLV